MSETIIKTGDIVLIGHEDTAQEREVVGLDIPLPFMGDSVDVIVQENKVLKKYAYSYVRKKR